MSISCCTCACQFRVVLARVCFVSYLRVSVGIVLDYTCACLLVLYLHVSVGIVLARVCSYVLACACTRICIVYACLNVLSCVVFMVVRSFVNGLAGVVSADVGCGC